MPGGPAGVFQSDEILWFDNGRWGAAGYAIPNPAGKLHTSNTVMFQIHDLIGRELFSLMHRPDVRFTRPPGKEFLFAVHKLCIVARNRLAARSVSFRDNRFDAEHATPVPRAWIVYPVPYFGRRVRNADAREWCELMLLLLSETMQHSDNELTLEVTDLYTSKAGEYFQRVLVLLATKFFGVPKAEALAPNFQLTDAQFASYDPSSLFVSSEMIEERPPLQWWPTENDLDEISGITINAALPLCRRWPATEILLAGDQGSQAVWPGSGNLKTPPGGAGAAASESFVPRPGAAPS